MLFYRRQLLLKAFKLLDLLVMVVAFCFTTIIIHFHQNDIPFNYFLNIRIKIVNIVILLGYTWIWYVIFVAVKLYHSKRLIRRIREVIDIIKRT